ncbi:hypothetical protein MNB_SUP05-SYMBIONT-5-351 [hydrothermal vent metagenome]|uniref:Uncharacterized protein n=1 Tax=hydrothermal vent metagenome TaxID=652676 RepID=A0A1W1E4H3_9ZZZZ
MTRKKRQYPCSQQYLDYLDAKASPLGKAYFDGEITYAEYVDRRKAEIVAEAFKESIKELTFNPLKMPYKHLKKFVIRLSIGIAILSFSIGQAIANPVVIYDNGTAIDAQQFYPFKKPNANDLKNIPRYTKKSIQRFPVITSMLNVGKVKNRKIKNRMPRAVCVVGDDKRSKKWIKKNRLELKSINALCMVVNVKSKRRLKSIKALAPNVEFQALNGDIFAKQLGIKYYPFLLNKENIRQ